MMSMYEVAVRVDFWEFSSHVSLPRQDDLLALLRLRWQ
jgi:hypothetical protein